MPYTRKATIAFPPELHRFLSRIARQKRVTLAALVRTACESRYGFLSKHERLKVLQVLRELPLLTGAPHSLKREAVSASGEAAVRYLE